MPLRQSIHAKMIRVRIKESDSSLPYTSVMPTLIPSELEKLENDGQQELSSELRRDVLAADMKLSLFVGAVQNFKYESLLKPVPLAYKKADGEVDIERLRNLISRLPSLANVERLEPSLLELLQTVVLNGNHKLDLVSIDELRKETSGQIQLQIAPRWIFKVDYNPSRNENWERRKGESSSFFAFHGSRFENFYSILNLGLHQHLNKTSLFGEGIYLSTEQSVSLHYSSFGEGWNKSQLGPELSILAVCEAIDHPNVQRQSARPNARNSMPEKYILVTNNELVRPRYLLVFPRPKAKVTKMASFWEKYRFLLLIGFYVSLLLAIGLIKRVVA